MRVAMGEIVDIHKDLTIPNLTIRQKLSVIWEAMIADSKILGKKKKMEEEKEIQKRNDKFDALKDGILASLDFHLRENKTLAEFSQEAMELQLAIDRDCFSILCSVLESQEFNIYEKKFVELDPDLINSFGNVIPVIVSFKQKEVIGS